MAGQDVDIVCEFINLKFDVVGCFLQAGVCEYGKVLVWRGRMFYGSYIVRGGGVSRSFWVSCEEVG